MKIFYVIFIIKIVQNWHSYGHILTATVAEMILE